MSDLYTIDSMLARLLDIGGTIIDEETGEVVPFDEVLALQMARADKIEGWGLWIKNRRALITSIKAEEKALAERRSRLEKQLENSTARYQEYLAGEKVSTPRLSVSYRKSETPDITCLTEDLPAKYQRVKTTVEPDKVALKAALKAGEKIDGVKLVTKQNIQIR